MKRDEVNYEFTIWNEYKLQKYFTKGLCNSKIFTTFVSVIERVTKKWN
jgi:hypothetical protein